jgi:signal transduction histidine kinase
MKIKVRSIFSKIVLWFVTTLTLSLFGYVGASLLVSSRVSGRDSFVTGLNAFLLYEARNAFEEGGATQLGEYLKRLDSYTEVAHFLTNSQGIDLVSGEDRSTLIARRESRSPLYRHWPFPIRDGSRICVRDSDDRHYRLLAVFPPGFDTWNSFWYFLLIPVLIAGLCYALAVHLASPLLNLRKVMEKFGRGDLAIRFHSSRHDEIGDLAQAFNHMADQIVTLLSAERQLLQDVSHELRSPLARLGFAVELARSSPDRDAGLSRIRKEADRLSHMVDELLHLTRAEADSAAASLEPIALDLLLKDLVNDCGIEAAAQQCRLELRIDQTLVVTIDRELIRRACENVLRNAIRHAPPGSSVDIDLASQNGQAIITFRDHGPGVPHESLTEIFKPLYRVEDDRGRPSSGMGLGLAIARRAVELHRGSISASNASDGLIVVIELPLDGPDSGKTEA